MESFLQVTEAIENIALIVLGIAGAITAGLGLRVWSEQLRGTDRYRLAFEMMKAVYEARDFAHGIVGVYLWLRDSPGESESSEGRAQLGKQLISFASSLTAATAKIDAQVFVAKAVCGPEVHSLLLDLRQRFHDLHAQIMPLAVPKKVNSFTYREEFEAIDARLNESIAATEVFFRPMISGRRVMGPRIIWMRFCWPGWAALRRWK